MMVLNTESEDLLLVNVNAISFVKKCFYDQTSCVFLFSLSSCPIRSKSVVFPTWGARNVFTGALEIFLQIFSLAVFKENVKVSS